MVEGKKMLTYPRSSNFQATTVTLGVTTLAKKSWILCGIKVEDAIGERKPIVH